jgi:hypothetical protein
MKYMFLLFSFLLLFIPSFSVTTIATPTFQPSPIAIQQNQNINIASFTPKQMPISIKQASIQNIENGQHALRFLINNPNNVSIKSLTVALPILNSSNAIVKTIVKKIDLFNSNEVFVPINTSFNIRTGQSMKLILVETVVSSESANKLTPSTNNLAQTTDKVLELSFDQIPRILLGLSVVVIDASLDQPPFCTKAYIRGSELCASPKFICQDPHPSNLFSHEAVFLCEDIPQN